MDEVGLIIHGITDEGYLRFRFIGGVDRRVALGKSVRIGPKGVPGVVGLKAYHLVTEEEEKKIPKVEDLYIDIGADSKAEAGALVALGDFAAFDGEIVEFGDGLLKAKALDDRVGCAVLVKLLLEELPVDCTFVFTVQEEVGLRGAYGAAFSVKPDYAVVVEGTTAADAPVTARHKRVCAPGRGPVIPIMDGRTIYDRGLFDLMTAAAEKRGIPWQTKQYISGGTDGGAIQRSRAGVRTVGVAAAVRYLHSPSSVASIRDLELLYNLVRGFLEDMGDKYDA
jgi:endoglucanase